MHGKDDCCPRHNADRAQQRSDALLQHELDVLDIAHDLGLDYRCTRPRVVPNRELLQAMRQGIAQRDGEVAHRAEEERDPRHVGGVVRRDEQRRPRAESQQLAGASSAHERVDDGGGNDGKHPVRAVLDEEEHHGGGQARARGSECRGKSPERAVGRQCHVGRRCHLAIIEHHEREIDIVVTVGLSGGRDPRLPA